MEKLVGDEAATSWNQSTASLPLHVANPIVERGRARRIRRSKLDLKGTEFDLKEVLETVDNNKEEDEAFLSIGVDLGTTFSGVAWALSTSPEDINIVSSWDSNMPGQRDLHKVPSIVTYDSVGLVSSWGYKIDTKRRHQLSWFKLGLSDRATERVKIELHERHERLQKLLDIHKKTSIDVVADYLRCLWAHAAETIKRKIGKVCWTNMKLKIVLTVPAIWDHKAQELTKRAAEMAGMLERNGTTLELVAEPEAAALSVFNEMKRQKLRGLKVGDIFVVCDAGGGTVDLISYKIEQVEPLRLTMVCEATGGLCGAIFLDDAFEKQIRTLISADDYEDLGSRAKRKFMHEWEIGIKRTFKMDEPEDEKWHVDIPGYAGIHVPEAEGGGSNEELPGGFASHRPLEEMKGRSQFLSTESLNRVDPGTLILETGHLNAIFSEVCSKTKDLVGTQISVAEVRERKEASAILLVGGFGENTYLRQELERSFSNVEIQQPTKAWSAICRGAVLKGLGNDLVVNHISQYHYGCVYAPEFDAKVHQTIDRNYDQVRGVWVASHQIQWFLNRGQNVETQDPVRHTFFFPVKEVGDLKRLVAKIYYSDSLIGESRIEGGVKPLCQVKVNVGSSIFDELPVHKNEDASEWRQLDYVLEMQVSSGEICWAVKYKNVEAGTVKTLVGYEGIFDS